MKQPFLIIITVFLAFSSFTYQAINDDQSDWLINFEQAQQLAIEQDKPILMLFSGSDWCKPCILLKENILKTESFTTYANENLVLLVVDFPAFRKNKLSEQQQLHNDALADKYNPQGFFPNVVLINAKGEVLQQIEYVKNMTDQDFLSQLPVH